METSGKFGADRFGNRIPIEIGKYFTTNLTQNRDLKAGKQGEPLEIDLIRNFIIFYGAS
jgi:hypothetical protein